MALLNPSYLSQQPDVPAEQLHPLHPDVMSRQATINIGTIGHVAHGKTTLVKAITSTSTNKFHNEIERNITIKLGYANAKIFQCPKCPPPTNYFQAPSNSSDTTKCRTCNTPGKLARHISFIDCPGHDFYMATMLTGACVMDSAFLLIAADQPCPQSQTVEHLTAIEIAGVSQTGGVIVVQNKIDLITQPEAVNHCEQITNYLATTSIADVPIIPISAVQGYNIDYVLHYIVERIPVPKRDLMRPPRFTVIRSFDVNRSGCSVDDLKGGIAGGTLLQGILKLGDIIEIRPGIINVDEKGSFSCYPLVTRIVSICAEENDLRYVIPGGLVAIGTHIDPSLTRQDSLVGSVIGRPENMPPIHVNISVRYEILQTLICQTTNGQGSTITELDLKEVLLLTIGSNSVNGQLKEINVTPDGRIARIAMQKPICADYGEKIAISRRISMGAIRSWRLIGWGEIMKDEEWEMSM